MAQTKFKDMTAAEKKKLFKVLLACVIIVALLAVQTVVAIRLVFGPKEEAGLDPVITAGVWEKEASTKEGASDLDRAVSLTVGEDGNATLKCVDAEGSVYVVGCILGESTLTIGETAHKYSVSDNKGSGGKDWCLSVADTGGRVYFYR